MKRITPVLILSLLIALTTSSPALATDENSDNTQSTVLRTGGGCMGGAIIGSVIPIFGTLVGCAAGAAFAWFTRDQQDEQKAESAFVDAIPVDDE